MDPGQTNPTSVIEAIEPSPRLPIFSILAFVTAWVGGSILLLGWILHPVIPGGWISILLFIGFAIAPAFAIVRGLDNRFYPSATVRIFVFRPFWYAMLVAPLVALVGVIGFLLGIPFGAPRAAAYLAVSIGSVLLLVAIVAGYIGTRKHVVKELRVVLPGLPKSFDGLRITQVSDLHVGPQTSTNFLERIAASIKQSKPDLIFVTGDQVDDFAKDVAVFASAFGELEAPLGVFAVAGNHDVYAGWNAVSAGLSDLGMTVLVNESVPIVRENTRIWIAGIGDPAGSQWPRGGGEKASPDIEQTMRSVPDGEVSLVLAHNPALWQGLAQQGASLTLSGHTHYGQLAIPSLNWNIAGVFVSPSMGVHEADGKLLYINPGTNYWGPPFRMGTPPEITVLELRCALPGEAAAITVA